jgi:hypothetical protein
MFGGNSIRSGGSTAGHIMIQQFDQFQKYGQDNVDAAMKTFGAATKGAQTIAIETADYARKSFEQGSAAFEKLAGAKTLDKAVEIQTEFLKSAYEGFVAQSTKMGELYAAVAKDAFKPFETVAAKVPATK